MEIKLEEVKTFEQLSARTNVCILRGFFKFKFEIIEVKPKMKVQLTVGYRGRKRKQWDAQYHSVVNDRLLLERSNIVVHSPFYFIAEVDNPNVGVLYSREMKRAITVEELNLWIEANIA